MDADCCGKCGKPVHENHLKIELQFEKTHKNINSTISERVGLIVLGCAMKNENDSMKSKQNCTQHVS